MGNDAFILATLSGFVLIIVAILLFILGISQRKKLVQDFILGFVYLASGCIFVLYGWRFDPVTQIGMVLLTGSIVYWIIHEHRDRGEEDRYIDRGRRYRDD